MSWFWKVLKIEPTTEIYQVKKAYVAQVRQLKKQEIKDELPADAYQKLTEAEQAAIAYIEKQSNQPETIIEETHSKIIADLTATEDGIPELPVAHKLITKQAPFVESSPITKEVPEVLAVPKVDSAVNMEVANQDFISDLKQLLKDWPEKIQIANWQKLLAQYKREINQEKQEYQQLFLPFLAEELIYLPKNILFYLYETFEMDQLELTSSKKWYFQISQLPDFNFEVVFYLPEEEAYSYFESRYQLYLLVSRTDWQSHSFEIKKLLENFEQKTDWLQGQSLTDRDVENLAAIFTIKENLDKVVSQQGSLPIIEEHLLPLNSNLAAEKNQTAVFLRVVFTALRTKHLSSGDIAILKNTSEVYLEPDVKALLVGLAFYAVNDQEQAKKYFNQIKGSYAQLVKPLVAKENLKPQLLQPKANPPKKLPQMSKISPAILIRIVVLAAIGISLLGNIFGNQQDDFPLYEDDFEETDQDGEELNYPDRIEGEFYEYFVKEVYRSDREVRQMEFTANYVPENLKELFINYQREYYIDEEGSSYNDQRDEVVKLSQDETTGAFLFLTDNRADVILILSNSTVERVIGNRWESVSNNEWTELVEIFKVSPKTIIGELVEKYLAIEDWEREVQLNNLVGLVSSELMEFLELYSDQFSPDDFIGGSYQLSKKVTGEPVILINDQGKELLLVIELDQYGRGIKLVDDFEYEYDPSELATMKKQAEPEIPLALIE